MGDNEDLELQDELEGDEDDASTSGSDNSAPPDDDGTKEPKGKRVDDLMSKWQKAEARAKKAEEALAATQGNSSGASGDSAGDGAASNDADEFVTFARESARETLFKSDPRLAEAGLTADDISGTTLSEMKASFGRQVKLVNGLESRLRQKVLQEHGLDPDMGGDAAGEKTPDFARMSDKEFDEFMAARGTGRAF